MRKRAVRRLCSKSQTDKRQKEIRAELKTKLEGEKRQNYLVKYE